MTALPATPHDGRAGAAENPESQPKHRQRQSLQLQFAHAIAKPGGKALVLTDDNKRERWCSIDAAVATGRAFAVEVAPDILAVDSDQPERGDAVEGLLTDLQASGCRPVLVASGRPGHLHLFARIDDARQHRQFSARARSQGFDVRTCIRPALAAHRHGHQPELLDPADPEEALQALARPSAAGQHQRPRSRDHHRLSSRMRGLLENGDSHGHYSTRSELVQAITLGAVNAGWPFERLFWALRDPRNIGGDKVQEIARRSGEDEARRYVRLSWRKAQELGHRQAAVYSPETARAAIAQILALAERSRWPGKAGASDRAVLQVHIEIADALGNLVHGASVRQVAELAGVSWPTTQKAHKRLTTTGWLRAVQLSRAGRDYRATTWRLATGVQSESLTLITTRGACDKEC